MSSFYSTAYLVGNPLDSDFFGNDLSTKFLILRQEGNRTSMQVFYIDKKVKPISKISVVVVMSPDDSYLLMDSVIAFYPEYFRNCASLTKVKDQLKNITFLDLQLNKPDGWERLREEAFPYFKKLRINTATFDENWKLDR